MKRVLMLAALAVLATSAFTQTNRGRFLISGSTDLSIFSSHVTYKYDDETLDSYHSSNFSFSPSVGYFVINNLVIMGSLTYNSGTIEDFSYNYFMMGPVVRYYFGKKNVKPFVNSGVMLGFKKQNNGDNVSKSTAVHYNLGGGIAFFINDFVAFDLGLEYSNETLTDVEDTNSDQITSGLGLYGGISVTF